MRGGAIAEFEKCLASVAAIVDACTHSRYENRKVALSEIIQG